MKTASRDEDSKSQQTARPVAILIVADNAVLARTLAITIKGFGGRGTAVGTVREALKHLAERATWAGVILDLCLSDGLGTRVLEWLRAKNETGRDLPVVLLTGHPDHSAVSIAHNLRAQFLEKPATTAQIEQFFRFAEQQARIRCQNELTPAPDFPADADPLGYFAAAILRERRAASADALRSFWRIGALVNGLRKQAKPHCLRAVLTECAASLGVHAAWLDDAARAAALLSDDDQRKLFEACRDGQANLTPSHLAELARAHPRSRREGIAALLRANLSVRKLRARLRD